MAIRTAVIKLKTDRTHGGGPPGCTSNKILLGSPALVCFLLLFTEVPRATNLSSHHRQRQQGHKGYDTQNRHPLPAQPATSWTLPLVFNSATQPDRRWLTVLLRGYPNLEGDGHDPQCWGSSEWPQLEPWRQGKPHPTPGKIVHKEQCQRHVPLSRRTVRVAQILLANRPGLMCWVVA